jgi:hypothetical protein
VGPYWSLQAPASICCLMRICRDQYRRNLQHILQPWMEYPGRKRELGSGSAAPGHPGVAGACESGARPSGMDAAGKRRTGRAGCGVEGCAAAILLGLPGWPIPIGDCSSLVFAFYPVIHILRRPEGSMVIVRGLRWSVFDSVQYSIRRDYHYLRSH